MHLASTINALSKSEGNIPVALFCFNEKRKFIRVCESYEETTNLVKQSFRVDSHVNIKLQTSALDVCRGQAVVIDESAYPLMWTVLDEIYVAIDDAVVQPLGGKRLGKAKEVMPTPLPTPDANRAPVVDGSSQIANVQDEYQEAEDIYQEEAELVAPEIEQEAEVKVDPINTQTELPHWGQAPFGSKRSFDNLRDDKEEGGSKRQKFKPVSSALRGAFSPVENNEILPRIKQEKVADSASPAPEISKPDKNPKKPNPGPPDDPRFEITIFGLTKAHQAKFKTRGKHPVRKVLAAACKSFDIEYESVKLVQVIMDDGEENYFELDEEESIGKCGINSESDLRIMPKKLPASSDDDDDDD